LTAQPALAAEKPPISLPRITKWEMKYDEDSCTLIAQFAAGEDAVMMALTRTAPGDWFEMRLYGKMLGYGEINMPFQIAFADDAPIKRTAMSASAGSDKKLSAAIIPNLRVDGWDPGPKPKATITIPQITAEQEAKIKSITFKPASKGRYRLETGSLGAPFAAMRTCTDDLVKHWGFDPAILSKLTRSAVPTSNPATWLGSNDFPSTALAQGMNGYVKFRLDVDPDGKVAGCRILYRTNPDEFADTSCQLLTKRAKFTPALDAGGKPVKSYYISAVKWLSPA
jgi:TonB family protein